MKRCGGCSEAALSNSMKLSCFASGAEARYSIVEHLGTGGVPGREPAGKIPPSRLRLFPL